MSPESKLADPAFARAFSAEAATLAELLEHCPEGCVLFDREFRIVYANAAARRISRLRPEHIGTLTHWEIYPETVGTVVEEAYRRVQRDRVAEQLPDFHYAPFDLWVRVRATPLGDAFAIYYQDVTVEHTLAVQKASSESSLRFALEAANGVGTWDWDIPQDVVRSDARFAEIYGVAADRAAAGTPIADFIANVPEEDLATLRPLIAESLRTGGEFAAEYRLRQPDGSIRWVAARDRTILNEAGEPVRFPGVALDITEQKRAAENAYINEERLRLAMTAIRGVGAYDWDVPNDVVYGDASFAEIYGVSPERFVTGIARAEFAEHIYPEDRAAMDEAVRAVLASGGDFSTQYRVLPPGEKDPRWVAIRGYVELTADGTPNRFRGVVVDITAEKRRDEQLRQSEERFRLLAEERRKQYEEIDRRRRELEAIYNGSPIGMALYEPKELRLTRLNTRQAEIFHRTPEEAMGQRYEELAAGVPEALRLIRRAAAGEFILNHPLEGALASRPDEHRYWNINYSPIFAEDGSVQAIAAATVEITTQKQGELALIQSEKLAAVGRMAASIAHEINNPLESVTNLLFLARGGAIVPEVQGFLDLAEQELRRVSVIANQTLRFHKQATRPTECQAAELFDNVLSLYEGKLRNAGIEASLSTRTDLPFYCFEGDIRQVLSNLIGNAIDAMPNRGKLLLRSRRATDWKTGVAGVALTVADTGTGISPETLGRIFEPFFTTKGFNGTGLGLWISSEILDRHHGRLRVRSSQSELHHGTVFSLFLPFSIEPAA